VQKYSTNQIIGPLVIVLGLGVALLMGRWVAQGQLVLPALVIGGIFGSIFFLALGRLYWYLVPFALASNLPTLPIGGRTIELGELFVAACSAVFLARIALKKEELVIFRATHIPILLSFAWIVVVWANNPTGLIMFGSETIGARFYLKILLGFFAFVMLASQKPSEEDLQRIILLVFFGIMTKAGFDLARHFVFGVGGDIAQPGQTATLSLEEYSWHQILADPALIIVWYLLARFKVSELFSVSRPWGVLVFLFAVALAMMSGKRMALALILVSPFIAAFLHKEYSRIWLGLLAGLIVCSLLIFGHGVAFRLPFSAQRALSWLPAEWDEGLSTLGTQDTFREQLREWAMDEIKGSPWIGKGYALDLNEVSLGIQITGGLGGYNSETALYAISRSWHNRWLGYSADFGIPFAVLLAAIYLTGLVVSFRLARASPYPSGSMVFAFFVFLSVFRGIATSHTSGHTALDAFNTWWFYGLLFALYAKSQSGLGSSSALPMVDPKPLRNGQKAEPANS
jgi:hypothetical protein